MVKLEVALPLTAKVLRVSVFLRVQGPVWLSGLFVCEPPGRTPVPQPRSMARLQAFVRNLVLCCALVLGSDAHAPQSVGVHGPVTPPAPVRPRGWTPEDLPAHAHKPSDPRPGDGHNTAVRPAPYTLQHSLTRFPGSASLALLKGLLALCAAALGASRWRWVRSRRHPEAMSMTAVAVHSGEGDTDAHSTGGGDGGDLEAEDLLAVAERAITTPEDPAVKALEPRHCPKPTWPVRFDDGYEDVFVDGTKDLYIDERLAEEDKKKGVGEGNVSHREPGRLIPWEEYDGPVYGIDLGPEMLVRLVHPFYAGYEEGDVFRAVRIEYERRDNELLLKPRKKISKFKRMQRGHGKVVILTPAPHPTPLPLNCIPIYTNAAPCPNCMPYHPPGDPEVALCGEVARRHGEWGNGPSCYLGLRVSVFEDQQWLATGQLSQWKIPTFFHDAYKNEPVVCCASI